MSKYLCQIMICILDDVRDLVFFTHFCDHGEAFDIVDTSTTSKDMDIFFPKFVGIFVYEICKRFAECIDTREVGNSSDKTKILLLGSIC